MHRTEGPASGYGGGATAPPASASRRGGLKAGLLAACAAITIAALAGATALAAGPPAGTPIGNQASATYDDGSGTIRTTTSNTVSTIVQQVAALTLSSNGFKNAAPGQPVVFPHTLTNVGNGTDTFALSVTSNAGTAGALANVLFFADLNGDGAADNPAAPITSSGPLAADGVFNFVVTGNVPVTALQGNQNLLQVRATSQLAGGGNPFAGNNDTTTVSNNGVVDVLKSMSPTTGGPGTVSTVTLTFTNTGVLAANKIQLNDQLPSTMSYVAGSGRWSGSGTTPLTDAAAGDPSGVTYSANITPRLVQAEIATLAAGQSGTLTFQVTIVAGAASGSTVNTATFAYNDGTGAGLPINVGTPTPLNTNAVTFTIAASASVVVDSRFVGPPTVGANDTITVASANEGASVTFTAFVHNTGNGSDTFDLAVVAGTFPPGTSFTLLQGDGATPIVGNTTGPVPAGGTFTAVVRAQLPGSVSGAGPFNATLIATSRTNPFPSDPVTLILTTVVQSAVDLSTGQGTGAGQGVGDGTPQTVSPGASVAFPLRVTNTAGPADVYNLSVANLPAGATVQFFQDANGNGVVDPGEPIVTSTGTLNPGQGRSFVAVVSVAAGSVPGSTPITFRAESPITGAFDTMGDAVSVNQVRAFALSPNNNGQLFPGGSVVYSHTLSNLGNVSEGGTFSTLAFGQANSTTFTSAVFEDTNGNGLLDGADLGLGNIGALAPGASRTIFVRVFAPAGMAAGSSNVTTLTVVTTNGTNTGAVPASVVATDTTSVISGDVNLLKEQAVDSLADGAALPTTFSSQSANARPGDRIVYRITVTNTGTSAATSVTVTDTTPAFTKFVSAATSAGTVTTAPTAGTTGSIVASVGTLAPGASAQVTIVVRLNPVQ